MWGHKPMTCPGSNPEQSLIPRCVQISIVQRGIGYKPRSAADWGVTNLLASQSQSAGALCDDTAPYTLVDWWGFLQKLLATGTLVFKLWAKKQFSAGRMGIWSRLCRATNITFHIYVLYAFIIIWWNAALRLIFSNFTKWRMPTQSLWNFHEI